MPPFVRQCLIPLSLCFAACAPREVGPAVTYVSDTALSAYSLPADSGARGNDVLRAMGEPPLPGATVRPRTTVIRFFWSRAFHPDVAVRLVIEPKRCNVFTTVMTHPEILWGPPDRRGVSAPTGSVPGKIVRQDSVPLLAGDCKAMRSTLERNGLWQVGSRTSPGMDGSDWRFELVDATSYKFVEWWSPTEQEGRQLWGAGLALLKLANALPAGPREIY